ncbi:MAG: hypothetical protein SGI77_24410 [Pirellulaceae bacterium]|nr:hypothetical protein [Pirellulaceae bacterium]
MIAPIIELANEVVTLVNGVLDLNNQNQVGVRQYNPIVNLKEMPELRCVVYPARNISETDFTRKLRQHEYEIQILVQAKLGPPNISLWNSQIDEMTGLVDTIAEVFRAGDRMPVSLAYCVECDIDPVFAAEHLDQRNVFSSVINLTFRQERS